MVKKYAFAIALLLLVVIAEHFDVTLFDVADEYTEINDYGSSRSKSVIWKSDQDHVHVSHIVDGDTFDVNTGERVRLIGIDTPERGKIFYKDATKHLSELILDKDVILVKDVSDVDRYGRLLRHVYVQDRWVNEEMIKDGFARLVTYPPDVMHVNYFRDAEIFARENKLGIWSFDEKEVYGEK